MKKTIIIFLYFLFAAVAYASEKDTLIIATWNVEMLPRPLFHINQSERAREIVKAILLDSIDIIVFQELFDTKARLIITKGLSAKYKYAAGPGAKSLIKTNSGVMFFSKKPIEYTEITPYKDCKSVDCFGKKAFIYSKIKMDGSKNLNFYCTHLQSRDGNDYDAVRLKQMLLLSTEIEKNKINGDPIILAGDFNTSDCDNFFQKIISLCHVKSCTITGECKYSWDCDNTMHNKSDKTTALLDHIFLNENGNAIFIKSVEIIRYKYFKKGIKKDISDHYAVKAKIIF